MSKIDLSLKDAFRRAREKVEGYGVRVYIGDVKDPNTGIFDGSEIGIDYANDLEMSLFVMVHLFGHTVQWNTDPRARAIGTARVEKPTEEFLTELRDYESRACAYSLQLFHDAGVNDLDQWMADFAACDSAYLMHFYRTGEKIHFRNFWKAGMPLVQALPIPTFQPARWVARNDGVVI